MARGNDYYDKCNRYPLLTPQQEREAFDNLARAREEKDEKAIKRWKDKIVCANLRYAIKIAYQYVGCYNDTEAGEELICEANLGLAHAIDHFDTSKKNRFTTYADYWIRRTINDAIRRHPLIRTPNNVITLKMNYRKAESTLEMFLGRTPEHDEVMDYLGYDKREAARIEASVMSGTMVSLDDVTGDDEGASPLVDLIEDANLKDKDEQIIEQLLAETMNRKLDILNEVLEDKRVKEIITLRYGLGGEAPYTLEMVGRVFGITRERVRQIQDKAIKLLRDDEELRNFLE
jgi:RNA polymerase primary sigma factor